MAEIKKVTYNDAVSNIPVKGVFSFLCPTKLIFGAGSFQQLPGLISSAGKSILLVTGASSFRNSDYYPRLAGTLSRLGITVTEASAAYEPSPCLVDEITRRCRDASPDLVVAIGGGSVLDTGKAVSAMAVEKGSITDFIEEAGKGKKHSGRKIPFIAVPTTSGTGSEATNNAVISRIGKDGFKKSLRHDNFFPDVAVVDPRLCLSCPGHITAASGFDAISQLIGAFVSTQASVLTDSIVTEALKQAGGVFMQACGDKKDDIAVRSTMAYASFTSGIALANTGLCIVHGLASSIGSIARIPHGVVCGTMLLESVRLNLKQLKQQKDKRHLNFLKKYALCGMLLSGSYSEYKSHITIEDGCKLLVKKLKEWQNKLRMPRLGSYGIGPGDITLIAGKTSLKNNPVPLDKKQIKKLVEKRL